MSRCSYDEGLDNWELIRWRGAVASAIKGKRGKACLQEMATALDALEAKRLIKNDLVRGGEACALGVLGIARGLNMEDIDPEDLDAVAETFGIARALAAEIMFINDDFFDVTPEYRFWRVRQWITEQIGKGN